MSEVEKKISAIQKVNLFPIPIYKIRFADHEHYKQEWIDYLENEDGYNASRNRHIQFTTANLHKAPIFEPLVDFMHYCLQRIMDDYGFVPDIKLTGMWGTKHAEGGYHHRHTHHNTFMAGVYYLDGAENSSGTVFYNPRPAPGSIDPAHAKNRRNTYFSYRHVEKFEEGTLILFPAWLSHDTMVNRLARTGQVRRILGINAMPVGMTNTDLFDRYSYPDPDTLKMINRPEEKINYRPPVQSDPTAAGEIVQGEFDDEDNETGQN